MGGIPNPSRVTKQIEYIAYHVGYVEMGDGIEGQVSVKSYYHKLLVRNKEDFPHLSIWTRKPQRKVCFFAWLVLRGAILRAKNLRKRRITWVKRSTANN